MQTHAELSECRKYRYALWRTWDESKKKVMFIGLNPAAADEIDGDRTITRCISYAKQWGYGGIIVGNLFSYRTKSPEEMKKADDPIGPINDEWLLKLKKEADLVVAMWGNHGSFLNRHIEVKSLFPDLKCLRVTGVGQPHHTRGLPDGLMPIDYNC
ncbi:DUF1643 domain-containing protein [Vogesella indigofera]|uniref:DUF1643 domain-containing protein n=1 Tax=Vogesella indigofera TaxID=45465 RepID=UPI0035AEAF6B